MPLKREICMLPAAIIVKDRFYFFKRLVLLVAVANPPRTSWGWVGFAW
jgi:hypothetical protein